MQVHLRNRRSSDLPTFFEHQCDAEAAETAGSIPRTRPAFDEHWRRIIAGPRLIVATVEADGRIAGYVSAFSKGERFEIAYWLGREYRGRGIGQTAVSAFLEQHRERPIFASASVRNLASLAILRRCGFNLVAEETASDGLRERHLRLD